MAFKPIEFIRQVRVEGGKVTWPTWKETRVSTIMVFILTVIAAIFLLVVDSLITWLLRIFLG